MTPARGADQLLAGRRALELAQWDDARSAFEQALEEQESPDARDGLGQALWFLGRVADGLAARAQAFEQYARDGRCGDAARVAVWLSHLHVDAGRASAARGWLSRAERALENAESCPGHGWLALGRALHAADLEHSADHARQAIAIARECGAGDLEVFAMSLLGSAEVRAGHQPEGMALLEEAMAAASAGHVRHVHALGIAYCKLISACTTAGAWANATEWCEFVDEFAREHDATPLLGACRTTHAEVLLATGRWPEAEQALQSALEQHARHGPRQGAPTVAALAELRVRQGRLAEAEELLADREELPSSLCALAHLRIAEGRPQIAASLLERGLMAAGDDLLRAAQLLAPLVDARLACGDASAAQAAVDQLAGLARDTQLELFFARADIAAARLALAGADAAQAAEPARRALALFSRLEMPLDAGEARLELARALALDQPELARDEARTALATFHRIGASRAMDRAAAVLRELGAGTAARPRGYGELTAREQEVLALVARGMTNAQIAQALFISEKTAGHHVSRILSKLGVRNRAEAAAHAARGAPAAPTG